jgi:hypothetical protein
VSPVSPDESRPQPSANASRGRRAVALLGAVVLALALSACARKDHVTSADAGNLYVNAGPLTYQVQVTRALNPFSTEDAQYLAGIPNAQKIPANQLWFGVFLWAKNQSGRSQTTSDQFAITDSSGTVYHAVNLNPQVNQYAWTPQQLGPDGTEPAPDTTASYGPTQGGLILFRLSDSVYSNRPLTLDIYSPNQTKPTTVSLDL